MSAAHPALRRSTQRILAMLLFCMSWCFPGNAAHADEYRIAADTKIQIAVVQWNPATGEYKRWEALGGTFQVSQQGTIGLPVVGSLSVGGKTSTEVATQLAVALRDKMGLRSPPDVTVEIAEYPPIYIVGSVTNPGAYPYKPGLTVLQALAIAGGRFRPSLDKTGQNDISLRGELATILADKLRLIGRVARLEAEISGDTEIRFPGALTADKDTNLVAEVIGLENRLFAARANETKRQLTTLAELRTLYASELETLDATRKDSRAEIELTSEEVTNLTKLVEKGVATTSRWSELRRALAQMRVAHSESDIAAMQAQQKLSETTRQEFGINDQRQTELATELRDSQAELAKLKSREETVRQLLLAETNGSLVETAERGSELVYVIVRQSQPQEIVAKESTPLEPGDVLKVQVGKIVPG